MVRIVERWDLGRLLAPHMTPEDFFEEYFEKKHLHLKRDQDDFYNSVFGLFDVEPVARRSVVCCALEAHTASPFLQVPGGGW